MFSILGISWDNSASCANGSSAHGSDAEDREGRRRMPHIRYLGHAPGGTGRGSKHGVCVEIVPQVIQVMGWPPWLKLLVVLQQVSRCL